MLQQDGQAGAELLLCAAAEAGEVSLHAACVRARCDLILKGKHLLSIQRECPRGSNRARTPEPAPLGH